MGGLGVEEAVGDGGKKGLVAALGLFGVAAGEAAQARSALSLRPR